MVHVRLRVGIGVWNSSVMYSPYQIGQGTAGWITRCVRLGQQLRAVHSLGQPTLASIFLKRSSSLL